MLTAKQSLFVEMYFRHKLNATRAYREAYGTENEQTAAVNGARLLKNAKVAEAIEARRKELVESTGITPERVLQEFGRIAFADMRTFVKWGPDGVRLNDSEDLDDNASACVAEVSETTSEKGGSIKFKLHDKVNALTQLAKHLGMFTEKHEHSFSEMSPEDRTNRIAALLNGARDRVKATNGNGKH